MSKPIILDVDTGLDDALALGLGVLDPEIELVAVTTVAGNVEIDHTTPNTLTVLDWFGATGMPVFRGASQPLVRPLRTAAEFQGADGLGNSGLPPSHRSSEIEPAPAAIIRLARSRPGEVTLVCAGPLTNLAIALILEPELPGLLDGVVIMGGAFHVPGNITEHAEFNTYCDPEAAAQVFAAAERFGRVTAVGLDVCHQVALTHADYVACQAAGSPGARLFARIARQQFADRPQSLFYLYDPLALVVASNPDLVRLEPSAIAVDCDETHRGRTRVTGSGPVLVARKVDSEAFLTSVRAWLGVQR